MTYLLQISLGPVQSFIAASRKTRDLAAGSALLVALSQTAARELHGAGAALIFPPDPDAPAANILLAECEDPRALAQKARTAVLQHLKREVRGVGERESRLVDGAVSLDAQADAALEWFAVWTPRTGDYSADRRRAAALMAARKALRDFIPAPPEPDAQGNAGRPKSPLDPAFAGVLKLARNPAWSVARGSDTRVKPREHLDAVGLVKRFATFPNVSRFDSTRAIAYAQVAQSAAPQVETVQALLRDTGFDFGDALADDLDGLDEAKRQGLKPLLKDLRDAAPETIRLASRGYYAVLHGDGDGVGGLLDAIAGETPERHRAFSRELSQFATGVTDIVRRHAGTAIYAGGDDVVALAPVETAIELAQALDASFDATLGQWARENAPEHVPTLTLGVAIVHVMDNLQECVTYSASLEKRGKRRPGKHSLTVGARPRGGAAFEVVLPFGEAGRIEDLKDALKDGLPRGYPYEIRALADELDRATGRHPRFVRTLDDAEALDLATVETKRIHGRKQDRSGHGPPEMKSLETLRTYSDLLLVAHFLTREAGA